MLLPQHTFTLFPYTTLFRSIKQDLVDELTSTRRQAAAAALHAKAEAVSHADKLAERIGEERLSQHKEVVGDRKSTRLNSSHEWISYAVFCLKKKKKVRRNRN